VLQADLYWRLRSATGRCPPRPPPAAAAAAAAAAASAPGRTCSPRRAARCPSRRGRRGRSIAGRTWGPRGAPDRGGGSSTRGRGERLAGVQLLLSWLGRPAAQLPSWPPRLPSPCPFSKCRSPRAPARALAPPEPGPARGCGPACPWWGTARRGGRRSGGSRRGLERAFQRWSRPGGRGGGEGRGACGLGVWARCVAGGDLWRRGRAARGWGGAPAPTPPPGCGVAPVNNRAARPRPSRRGPALASGRRPRAALPGRAARRSQRGRSTPARRPLPPRPPAAAPPRSPTPFDPV
jgi:hypothetical protein